MVSVMKPALALLLSQIYHLKIVSAVCMNDPDYAYIDPDARDYDPDKNCQWIRFKEERRQRLCQLTEVHLSCPISCGICCEDDASYSFKNGESRVSCDWITGNESNINNWCKQYENGRMVRDACPLSCEFCPFSYISVRPSTGPILTGEPSTSPSKNMLITSENPSTGPSVHPSALSSPSPSLIPTISPSLQPSDTLSTVPTVAASSSPSSIPSTSPIATPTEKPSTKPTINHSTSPTSSPSASPSDGPFSKPSISPSNEICINDPNYVYIDPDARDYDPDKNCQWIRFKEERRQRLCQLTEVHLSCPISCGICCEDDASYSFKNGESIVSCDWITGNESNINNWCKQYVNGRMVRDACPLSCEFCPFSYISVRPSTGPTLTGEPSTSPSTSPSKYPSTAPSGQPTLSPSTSPSTKPSFPPSTSPTSSISNTPTGKPTIQPTQVPTNIPSHRSSASGLLCLNNASYAYGGDKAQTCKWIRFKEERRLLLCKEAEVSSNCPLSCGQCCEDDDTYTFLFKFQKSKLVGCDILSDETVADKFCDKWKSGRTVRDGCPKSCHFCKTRVNAIVSPTNEPTTTEPTDMPTTTEPSNAPSTTEPTNVPTTTEPTNAPTTTEPLICLNNESYAYGGDKAQTCKWIRFKEERRVPLCKEAEVSSNCPLSCGQCCEDDDTYTFLIKSQVVGCDILSDETVADKFCDKWKSGRTVRDGCPKSCDFCFVSELSSAASSLITSFNEAFTVPIISP